MTNRVEEMAIRMVEAGLTPVIEDEGAQLCAMRGPGDKALSVRTEALVDFPEGFYQGLLRLIDEIGVDQRRREGNGVG